MASNDIHKFIKTTEVSDLLILDRPTFDDNRGFFREVAEKRDFEQVVGKELNIVQWNHSRSHPNVIRGIHAEPWDKIIYCTRGEIFAVMVDLRINSSTFGKAFTWRMGETNRQAIYVPQGVANSFCNLGTDDADYCYLVTKYYDGSPTPAISWSDPRITKQFGGWPVVNPTVSEKDKHYPTIEEKFGSVVDLGKYPWLQL